MGKEIDIAVFPFITSLLRNEVVEHAGYYAYDRVGILALHPTPQVSWTSVIQPYSVNVKDNFIFYKFNLNKEQCDSIFKIFVRPGSVGWYPL